MKLKEEQKLSLEAGEFIHTIANFFNEKRFNLEYVDALRCQVLMELSNALRRIDVKDIDAPLLLSEGYRLTEHPRSDWIDLATRFLCECDVSKSASDIIKKSR